METAGVTTGNKERTVFVMATCDHIGRSSGEVTMKKGEVFMLVDGGPDKDWWTVKGPLPLPRKDCNIPGLLAPAAYLNIIQVNLPQFPLDTFNVNEVGQQPYNPWDDPNRVKAMTMVIFISAAVFVIVILISIIYYLAEYYAEYQKSKRTEFTQGPFNFDNVFNTNT